jgi:hypothetical protein
MESSNESKKNFFKYVLNFDEDTKSEVMNIMQFSIIGLVPMILFMKIMDKYVPEIDDTKGSVEILAEIIIQILVLFIAMYFVNRIITYFPTFSGMDYPKITIFIGILSILFGFLVFDSKIKNKINILTDRLYELWEGKPSDKKKMKQGNVKVSQPISQNRLSQTQPQSQMQSMPINYNDGTSISSLPTHEMASQQALAPQQLPNYNAMYRQDNNPLVNAATPGMQEGFNEPMAANDALGGSFGGFSSW